MTREIARAAKDLEFVIEQELKCQIADEKCATTASSKAVCDALRAELTHLAGTECTHAVSLGSMTPQAAMRG